MDKVQLIKIINEVVEYKLKKLVPQIEKRLRESIEKELLTAKVEETEEPSDFKKLIEAVDSDLDDEGAVTKIGVPTFKKNKQKTFSTNPILNKVLNETYSTPKHAPDSEYERIISEMTGTEDQMKEVDSVTFNTMSEMLTGLTPIKSPNSDGTTSDGRALKLQIAAESGDPDLANIIVKDYRAVLKKAEEKSKAKWGKK